MNRETAFAYAGARIQARYGQLLAEGQWDRLGRIPDFRLFVQTARDSPLRAWVQNLDAGTGAHAVEAALRAQFRTRVADAARWAPRPWRPALRWIETLPDLPAARHLSSGRGGYAWMAADPAMARLLDRSTGAAVPGHASDRDRSLAAGWLERWRSLWPEEPVTREGLDRLAQLAGEALRNAPREGIAAAAARLQPELRRLFRARTRAPAGIAAYLALSWLELVRLRGALLRRRFELPLAVPASAGSIPEAA